MHNNVHFCEFVYIALKQRILVVHLGNAVNHNSMHVSSRTVHLLLCAKVQGLWMVDIVYVYWSAFQGNTHMQS